MDDRIAQGSIGVCGALGRHVAQSGHPSGVILRARARARRRVFRLRTGLKTKDRRPLPANQRTTGTGQGHGPWAEVSGTRVLTDIKGLKKAGQDLEGSGNAAEAGFPRSPLPCTTLLSVAGFLAVLSLFLARGAFFAQGGKGRDPGNPPFHGCQEPSGKMKGPGLTSPGPPCLAQGGD